MSKRRKPKPSPTTLVRIDKDVLEKIRAAAQEHRTSMRALVTAALLTYLSRSSES